MRRRRDLLVLGVLAALVLVVTLGPLVVAVVQVTRDPPPQHAELMLFGILGAAFDRLVWSLGVAVVVLLVRAVVAAIHSRRTGARGRIILSRFWRKGPAEELADRARPSSRRGSW